MNEREQMKKHIRCQLLFQFTGFFLLFLGVYCLVPSTNSETYRTLFYKELRQIYNLPAVTQYSVVLPAPKRKVKIAIVDTGVDFLHPYLKEFRSSENLERDELDHIGHGTNVAGVIAINLQKVFGKRASEFFEFQSFKYTPSDNIESYNDAIKRAIASDPDIINISSSGYGWNLQEKILLDMASKLDMIVVVAAGNEGRNFPVFPCSYASVICVGNTDAQGKRVPSSNFGSQVSVYALGDEVITTSSSALTDSRFFNELLQGQGGYWQRATGTSFSAPLITAQLAAVGVNPQSENALGSFIKEPQEVDLNWGRGLASPSEEDLFSPYGLSFLPEEQK